MKEEQDMREFLHDKFANRDEGDFLVDANPQPIVLLFENLIDNRMKF